MWAADARPAGEDDAKLLEWTLEVPDRESLTAIEESLGEAGYAVERAGGVGVLLPDPWGTPLRVVSATARRPRLEKD